MGKRYLVGSKENFVKLDVYYTDAFVFPVMEKQRIRMAATEEIIAMKMDIVERGGRKKDFWDLHELLEKYSVSKMIEFHQKRYPYGHKEALLIKGLANFSLAQMNMIQFV